MNSRKIYWLILVAAVVVAILWPGHASGQTEKKDLIIRFSPGSYPYEVRIGQDNIFYLEIENTGNQDIANIRLYANAPEGWTVEIKPETVGHLAARQVQTIDANVRPTAAARKGNYQIAFVAEGEGIRRVMTAWVNVEGPASMWLWVGIAIGTLVVAGFIFVFLRFGRQ